MHLVNIWLSKIFNIHRDNLVSMSIEAPVKRPCSGFIIVQIYFNPVEDLWHFHIEEVCTICNLYFGSSQNSATVDCRCLAFKHVVSPLRNDLLGTCQPMSTSASGSPNDIPGDKFRPYRSLELRGSSLSKTLFWKHFLSWSVSICGFPHRVKISSFLISKHQVSL